MIVWALFGWSSPATAVPELSADTNRYVPLSEYYDKIKRQHPDASSAKILRSWETHYEPNAPWNQENPPQTPKATQQIRALCELALIPPMKNEIAIHAAIRHCNQKDEVGVGGQLARAWYYLWHPSTSITECVMDNGAHLTDDLRIRRVLGACRRLHDSQ
ncbi:hypothetical protein AUR63_06005 [Guyparkeria sp. XI15]|nr:hypothetical protein AUR63_06005 [Guyparkeria sp. XI15]OAE84756.1 hypothetical protein AWR35_06015 [Guyparkeria sp. WRN-7]